MAESSHVFRWSQANIDQWFQQWIQESTERVDFTSDEKWSSSSSAMQKTAMDAMHRSWELKRNRIAKDAGSASGKP